MLKVLHQSFCCFFLVCEMITCNTFEDKKEKSSPYQQTEPEMLLAVVGSVGGLISLKNDSIKMKG